VAGGWAGAPLEETSLAQLRAQLDMNLVTAFLCCREAVRALRAGGGRIVNLGSRAALVPAGGALAYTAAKAALTTFTQGLAVEVKAAGILVNVVAPTTIDTAANRAAMGEAKAGSWTKPSDIAATIAWLASPGNTTVTGAIVPV
jgi:NAD(P)-dependent dehydrogenase (short-subunit alcohol dehydrogenase family)